MKIPKIAAALAVASMFGAGSASVWAENPSMPKGAADKGPEQYPADNSGRNQRDASDAAVTAGDQSNAEADVEITRAIRRAVTSDDSLSINAKNVKIITAGGVVTLRGPVNNEKERSSIAAKAQAVTGVTRVNNQLEVAAE